MTFPQDKPFAHDQVVQSHYLQLLLQSHSGDVLCQRRFPTFFTVLIVPSWVKKNVHLAVVLVMVEWPRGTVCLSHSNDDSFVCTEVCGTLPKA